MRTTITVGQLTPPQIDWLNAALRETYEFKPGALRMCITFEGAGSELVRHVEMPVTEWLLVMTRLQRLTSTVEAMLTPDAGQGISWGALPRERYEEIQRGWSGL